MRFTHLLLVSCCIALLCAALTNAVSASSVAATLHDNGAYRCIHDEIMRTINVPFDKLPQGAVESSPPLSHDAISEAIQHASELQPDVWQPIRIEIYYNDVDNVSRYCSAAGQTVADMRGGSVQCTADDILTAEKNDTLRRYLYPQIVGMNYEHLNVRRTQGNLVIPVLTTSICNQFTVPAAHHTDGVPNVDFALYLAVAPTAADVAAWAVTCAIGADGRPIAGVMNVSPRYIGKPWDAVRSRPIIHEVLHALGFDVRLFTQRNMVNSVSVRGKPASRVMNTPTVVAKAREHYGCDTLSYMELEDEGGAGTAGSHWERRNAKDEMMAGIVGIGYYTPMTIAAMEDTGFYKGNYDNAELMSWGYQAGCKLLNEKCVINGVSQEPTMFCTDTTKKDFCTSDRLSIGTCGIESGGQPLDTYYQYFADPTEGGTAPYMDHCPIIENHAEASCITGDEKVLAGSVFGSDARCFDSATDIALDGLLVAHAICAHVQCYSLSSTYQIQVRGAAGFVDCTEGNTLDLHRISSTFQSGTVTCPSFASVCQMIPYKGKSSSTDDGGTKYVKRILIIAIIVPVVGVLLLVGLGILIWRLCVRQRKRQAARLAATSQIVESES